MPADPQWYEPNGKWPGLVVAAQIISTLLAPLAIAIAIWGDWLKDRFGWRGRAELKLEIDITSAPAHHHHGWIDNASALATPKDWVNPREDGRLEVQFFRAKISNRGPVAAKSVTLWIKRLESLDPTNHSKPLENVMPLRWSDFWRFTVDTAAGKITGSQTDVSFATLPAGSSKYCDLCFYYDLAGPDKVGGFERGSLYLAVLNLPSSSYSMASGCHRVHLHLAAENCRPVDTIVKIDFNPSARSVLATLESVH